MGPGARDPTFGFRGFVASRLVVARPHETMVAAALYDALLQKEPNDSVVWEVQISRPYKAVFLEIFDVDFGDGDVGCLYEPARQIGGGAFLHTSEKRLWVPPNPGVPLPNLHYRAAQSADTDDRVKRCRTIANQEEHRPSRHARVLIAPCVAEVPPDVHQAESSEWTCRLFRRDEVQIWVYHVSKGSGPAVVMVHARLPKALRKLPAVAHKREDGGKLPVEDSVPLHREEKLLNGC